MTDAHNEASATATPETRAVIDFTTLAEELKTLPPAELPAYARKVRGSMFSPSQLGDDAARTHTLVALSIGMLADVPDAFEKDYDYTPIKTAMVQSLEASEALTSGLVDVALQMEANPLPDETPEPESDKGETFDNAGEKLDELREGLTGRLQNLIHKARGLAMWVVEKISGTVKNMRELVEHRLLRKPAPVEEAHAEEPKASAQPASIETVITETRTVSDAKPSKETESTLVKSLADHVTGRLTHEQVDNAHNMGLIMTAEKAVNMLLALDAQAQALGMQETRDYVAGKAKEVNIGPMFEEARNAADKQITGLPGVQPTQEPTIH
ncbi:hypothetical protein GC177_04930 [bacterium]|nr:hypothetical protein [bacterium]